MITACRANSTGDAVNHSLMEYYPISFLLSTGFFRIWSFMVPLSLSSFVFRRLDVTVCNCNAAKSLPPADGRVAGHAQTLAAVLKLSASRPGVVCCKSLCHVIEHEHRVIRLRNETWYMNKIRVN